MGIMPTETELTLEQTQQVTMEILLEPTSNKILVGDVGDSIWIELMKLDINLGPEWKLIVVDGWMGRNADIKDGVSIDKRRRFKLNLEVFRYIFKICPRVQGQDFDVLPTDEEIISFLRDLGHTRQIHSLNDVVVDQMHQPWRTFAALINRSLSGKTTGLDKPHLFRTLIL
ncbi:hypothetical protein Tco_0407048 [Tanacetum coccineum]